MLQIIYFYIVFLILFFIGFLFNHFFLDIELLKVLPPFLPILLLVALFTLLERKLLASIQRRRGPNVVGFFGLLQPIADALKLIMKETIIPGLSNLILFILAPVSIFTFSLLNWSILPFDYGILLADINLGLMFIFAISSLGVYSIIISG
jgi:NADH:ubiquinone oxidoreductase subunit H